GLDLSAHICGQYSRELMEEGSIQSIDAYIDRREFLRAQINSGDPFINPATIIDWANERAVSPILQCRDEFPNEDNCIQWIFDASGGQGISPSEWPTCREQDFPRLVGYAGGLNPTNVAAAVADIGKKCHRYWIDMESGVRNEQDRFDITLCRQVCEAVYGKDW
ncbi:MAG TPA: hypothetical protein VM532_12780, partial [Burkholderiales bacterium]|nr:hypothetical protein [Burkholderiales bacterium]